MMSRFKRFLRGSRGANAVEFALIAPVFLLLVFGMIDFGVIFKDWLILTNGVREGARAGVVERTRVEKITAATISVTDYTDPIGALDSLTVECCDPTDPDPMTRCDPVAHPDLTKCASGDTSLKVEAQHTTSLITPLGAFIAWFGGGIGDEVTVSANSEMRNE